MKKLMVAVCLAGACVASAAEKAENSETAAQGAQTEESSGLTLWGFGNYGIYSGYQLYGSLVNSEPTLQGYLEGNASMVIKGVDLGYLGVGIWSNTDLTDKRRDSYGKAFNEWDFNVHWGKTFWFDDEKKYGLDYRTTVVWYYYPHRRHSAYQKTDTTMDWNHSFAFLNPFVVPFIDVVHEYHESDGNLLQFGLKKTVAVSDAFSLTPAITFVWRNRNYGWCFPNYGLDSNFEKINSCLATMKIGVDANYQITEHIGLFAKVAYCSIIDKDLRDAAEFASGADYGQYKDFAWGGVGVSVNF